MVTYDLLCSGGPELFSNSAQLCIYNSRHATQCLNLDLVYPRTVTEASLKICP